MKEDGGYMVLNSDPIFIIQDGGWGGGGMLYSTTTCGFLYNLKIAYTRKLELLHFSNLEIMNIFVLFINA